MDIINFPVEYQKKLDAFNQEIDDLIRRRSEWLDLITPECCQFKVLDDIYYLNPPSYIGVVKAVKRKQDYDGGTNYKFEVLIEIETVDTSSRTTVYASIHDRRLGEFGTKAEYIAKLEQLALNTGNR